MSANESVRCTQVVRAIPLERFRLPNDGRKWKQAARSRNNLLLRLSSYANGDGTFMREGRNYSPSEKTLAKHIDQRSYYRQTDDLRDLGLLDWSREKNHYGRRVYVIRLANIATASENHLPDSPETPATFDQKSPVTFAETPVIFDEKDPDHLSHSQKTPVTSANNPSLPSGRAALSPSEPTASEGGNFPIGKFSENQNPPQDEEALTVEGVYSLLQQRYDTLREDAAPAVPEILPSTGRDRVFAAYRRRGCRTEEDLYDLGLLDTFDRWFKDRLVPSYEAKGQPIRSPLSLYADEGFSEFDARPKRAA